MLMPGMKHILGLAAIILFSPLNMMSQTMQPVHCAPRSSEIIACYTAHEIRLDPAHPESQWQNAAPVIFCADSQGKNPDEQRQTQVRVLWSSQTLYLRF